MKPMEPGGVLDTLPTHDPIKVGRVDEIGSPDIRIGNDDIDHPLRKSASSCGFFGVVRGELTSHDSSSCSVSVSSDSSQMNFDDSRSTHFSGGSVICEASVGDSDIQRCNARNWEDIQTSVAQRVWQYATENLGVVGLENDQVYIEAIKKMETRDQEAKKEREMINIAQ